MINKNLFNELKGKYPFIAELPEKLQDIISGRLSPDIEILNIYPVHIAKKRGCLIIFKNEMYAYWMSKFLFKKLPTYQNFNYSQVNEIKELNDTTFYIHSSASPESRDQDYEEGEFTFNSANQKKEVTEMVLSNATRLK